MALYRFSCSGNVIDEREFYSGEEVYAHAQYLANHIGYEVDFAVMPKCDTVKPQRETEAAQESDWERQTAFDGKLETQAGEDEELETQADEDEESETQADEDGNGAGVLKAVFACVATMIAGITALAVLYFTNQPSTDTTKLTESRQQKSTPAPILNTGANQLAPVKARSNTAGTGDSSSKPAWQKPRKSTTESSDISSTQKSVGRIVDADLSDESLDSYNPPAHRRQSATADTKKEVSTLRGKSLPKSPSTNQLRRQKRQSGSGSGGPKDEAASPRQSSQSPHKLPSGGY